MNFKNLVNCRVTVTLKNAHIFSGLVVKFEDNDLYLQSKADYLIITNVSENIVTAQIHAPPEESISTGHQTCIAVSKMVKDPPPPKQNNIKDAAKQRKQDIANLKSNLASYFNQAVDMNAAKEYMSGGQYDSLSILRKK